jgi:hypothetical protein
MRLGTIGTPLLPNVGICKMSAALVEHEARIAAYFYALGRNDANTDRVVDPERFADTYRDHIRSYYMTIAPGTYISVQRAFVIFTEEMCK